MLEILIIATNSITTGYILQRKNGKTRLKKRNEERDDIRHEPVHIAWIVLARYRPHASSQQAIRFCSSPISDLAPSSLVAGVVSADVFSAKAWAMGECWNYGVGCPLGCWFLHCLIFVCFGYFFVFDCLIPIYGLLYRRCRWATAYSSNMTRSYRQLASDSSHVCVCNLSFPHFFYSRCAPKTFRQ